MKTTAQIESIAITADHIPAVPAGAEPLSTTAKSRLLKLREGERATVREVLVEVDQRKAQVLAELGSLVPDPARAAHLLEALDRAGALQRKIDALMAWARDEEAHANADAMAFVNSIATEVKHIAVKRPALAANYPAVMALTVQRADAIFAGVARARATKRAAAEKKSA